MSRIRRFLGRTLAIIGFFTILAVIGVGFLVRYGARRLPTQTVPARLILDVDLDRDFAEFVPDDPIAALVSTRRPVLRDVLDALERGRTDERVKGVLARVSSPELGLAQVQDVRDAVAAFRKSGKPAFVFAESFGEGGPGNRAYYLASAFDEVWLQPSGDLGLAGVMAEGIFLRGTLDKLGIVPRLDHRWEYKAAMNQFTETKFTAAQAESTRAVMTSQFGQLVRGVAGARGVPEDTVRGLTERGPFSSADALQLDLVDHLGYRDEALAQLETRIGKVERMSPGEYLARAGGPYDEGDTIAVVYGVGPVQSGQSGFNPVFGEVSMGADTVGQALRAAAEDTAVRAIVFRVDSPGGSYVASDTIWRETVRAKQAGKPLIVTMGNVAASGGYFVAMHADKIVAQPGTITGSIGVLGGKMLTGGLLEKLGISWDDVRTSNNATTWSALHDYGPEEWQRFQASLDRIYDDFTSKVAAERRIPKEKVLEIAKGRVWSGEEAKGLGLVDELGGFDRALALAKEAAGIAADAPVQVKVYPREKTLIEVLVSRLFGRDDESGGASGGTDAALAAVRPLARLARAVGLAPRPGVLTAPLPPLP